MLNRQLEEISQNLVSLKKALAERESALSTAKAGKQQLDVFLVDTQQQLILCTTQFA